MAEKAVLREVAILFTDLVGSSEMYSRLGNRKALEIVEAHFEILLQVLGKHHGRLVKTIGDAIFGAFKTGEAAVRCAMAMQQAIMDRTEDQRFHGWPVRIRAGVHSGTGLAVKSDLYGDAVNVAARVVGLAGEREVMCTDAVMADLPKQMDREFKFYAPIIPKGTFDVVEIFKWKTGSVQDSQTEEAEQGDLTPAKWHCDAVPRDSYAVAVVGPDGVAQEKTVADENVLVGREAEYDFPVAVQVRSVQTSRPHLCFRVVRDQLWVFDLESRNGVFLRYPGARAGELKVKNQAPVMVGTQGRFGDCTFHVSEPDPNPRKATPRSGSR